MITKNLTNIKLVLDKIEANPSCWNQEDWYCGSSHCFAGLAQIELTGAENENTVRRDARIFFGFTKHETDYYFSGTRTLGELKTALEDWYDRDGYNRDGYNRGGYDRDGYDSDGYDRHWYDRDGYDCHGYNRHGYDLDGYNRGGYNRGGYNRHGRDRHGYDRHGYDLDGFDINNNQRP